MPRCPNGTRRNKNTLQCEPKNKTISNNSTKKCTKGKRMPRYCIEKIIKTEKTLHNAIWEQGNENRKPEYYENMKTYLKTVCFPRNTKWSDLVTLMEAINAAEKLK